MLCTLFVCTMHYFAHVAIYLFVYGYVFKHYFDVLTTRNVEKYIIFTSRFI